MRRGGVCCFAHKRREEEPRVGCAQHRLAAAEERAPSWRGWSSAALHAAGASWRAVGDACCLETLHAAKQATTGRMHHRCCWPRTRAMACCRGCFCSSLTSAVLRDKSHAAAHLGRTQARRKTACLPSCRPLAVKRVPCGAAARRGAPRHSWLTCTSVHLTTASHLSPLLAAHPSTFAVHSRRPT
jgi:hypothetical protein